MLLEVCTEEQIKETLGHDRAELVLQLLDKLVAWRRKVPLEDLAWMVSQ